MRGPPSDAIDPPTGDTPAGTMTAQALFTQVYERLKAMASRKLPAHGATLQTTALVHELYLRMQTGRDLGFDAPAQFFAYAARAMRHLLRDRARDRLRQRAGGAWERQPLDAADPGLAVDDASEALALDEALDALEGIDARVAQVVELRYFAGLTGEQVADALGLNRRTVQRDWDFARSFLRARLGDGAGMSQSTAEQRSTGHER
ncbi:ECF-type sigma factor [Chiayiivirga flava]|uniref:RNA polymerase sigma factor (TIGR02999 family) n=1 Tax=Chiayiivirga flava TaxID=659595 RepID=A0A7W8D5A8_9GAMM|nr:ECF-type sigma factor [Chiayiivirga flava]MBB5208181.1 RNA polymerase sigma factor (TIGR02999 family) [Chiayiivirga flava]